LGQRLEVGFSEPPQWMEIVGVVNDTTNEALEGDVREQVFVPLRQQPEFLTANPALSLVVRQNGAGIEGIREAVWAVDRDQPVHLLQPMTQILAQASAQRRFTVTVLAVFAGLALLLAAVGLYGVMSGSVVARTRELGIRVALGAGRGQLLGLILGQGAQALGLGLLAGWLGAWAFSGWLRGLLYQTAPVDGWTYLGVALVLSVVGLIACWIPARRASRVDPLVALRHE
jgi:putative ABC transport system permease protein